MPILKVYKALCPHEPMSANRPTDAGLPVVSRDTLVVMLRDRVQQQKEGTLYKHRDEVTRLLHAENPLLTEFISTVIDSYENSGVCEEAQRAYIVGFQSAYELLRNQAQANQLENLTL